MDKRLREAWRFFMENAGYCTPPGRTACAFALAKAERYGETEGFTFEWEDDPGGRPEYDLSYNGPPVDTCEGCVCKDSDGSILAAVWAVWDADASYRRVIEAELASEAIELMLGCVAEKVLQI